MMFSHVSLRSMFRVVMSVTISALKRCSVRLHLQLFVLFTLFVLFSLLCFLVYSVVQHGLTI